MTDAAYRIVEHDGGWAYKLGDVFSETFASRQAAEAEAARVVQEQRMPGDDEAVSWEDAQGMWHDEVVRGDDRPNAFVTGAAEQTVASRDRIRGQQPASAAADIVDYAISAYDRGDQYARQGGRMARTEIRSSPVIALSLATVGGFILGLLLPRRT